jgi:hypothetical protein
MLPLDVIGLPLAVEGDALVALGELSVAEAGVQAAQPMDQVLDARHVPARIRVVVARKPDEHVGRGRCREDLARRKRGRGSKKCPTPC